MSWLLVFALLFNLAPASLPAVDEPPVSITNVQVEYIFADAVTIRANISQNEDSNEITIFLQSENSAPRQVDAQVSAEGNISAVFDLESHPIQVFDRVYYWFEVSFTDGTRFTSPSYWFDYMDNRFDWQKSESRWFTVYSTADGNLSGEEIQEISLAGLENATRILPVSPSLPIQVYVYPDTNSLTTALGVSSRDWTAAEAKPDLGILLVSETGNGISRSNLSRQIPHEIAHLLEYSITKGNYDFVPSWLLEGLAVNAEDSATTENDVLLQNAYRSNNLIPLEQLCNAFPPEAERSSLAYAESASFTNYISETYGTDAILAMLNSSQYGVTCTDLPGSVVGKDLGTLESDWLKYTFVESQTQPAWIDYWPFALILPLLLIGLLLVKQHGRVAVKKEDRHG